MARTSILVLSVLCATVVAAVAAPVPESLLALPHGDEFPMRLRGGAVWERVKSLAAVRDPAASFPAQWFDQKLNHSDPDSPTFKQKCVQPPPCRMTGTDTCRRAHCGGTACWLFWIHASTATRVWVVAVVAVHPQRVLLRPALDTLPQHPAASFMW